MVYVSIMSWYLKNYEFLKATIFNQTESFNAEQKIHNNLDSINQNTLVLSAVFATYQVDNLYGLKVEKKDYVEDLIDTNSATNHQDNIFKEELDINKPFKTKKK